MSKSFCDDPEIRDLHRLGSGKTSSPGEWRTILEA
jgi:hypothetical protein